MAAHRNVVVRRWVWVWARRRVGVPPWRAWPMGREHRLDCGSGSCRGEPGWQRGANCGAATRSGGGAKQGRWERVRERLEFGWRFKRYNCLHKSPTRKVSIYTRLIYIYRISAGPNQAQAAPFFCSPAQHSHYSVVNLSGTEIQPVRLAVG
jgi:hypothetical protein